MQRWFGGINHYYDIAATLTEQYNAYAGASEDFPILEEEWVLEHLQLIMDESDLELLLEDEFGKGLIMGQLRTIYTLEEQNAEEEEVDG